MTANNSVNNNNMFVFVSDLKTVCYNNYQSLITMPWTREEKYFVSLIWRQDHSKLCKQDFTANLTSQLSPEKPHLSLGTQISGLRVSKQPQQEGQIWQEVDCKISYQCGSRSGMKLTARSPINVDPVKDSVGMSLKKSLQRHFQKLGLSRALLQRILKKDLQLYPYRIQIKHKLSPADMEFLVSVINLYCINGLHLF